MNTRWSIGSSALASLCCVGPAIAALVGVGSASALVGLSRYRWPLLVLGLALLGISVGMTLRRLRTTCAPDRYRRYQWQVPLTALAIFGITYGVLTYGVPTLIYRSLQPTSTVSSPASTSGATAPAALTRPAERTQPSAEPTSATVTRYRAMLAISGMT